MDVFVDGVDGFELIEVYEILFREGFKSKNFNAIADCNICMALLT